VDRDRHEVSLRGVQVGDGNVQYNSYGRPEPARLPVRLAPRPEALVGREELLAELDACLTARPGRPGPRLAVLCGLGGAGKTSTAVEYAHKHLAEVGVCWQFQAEDPAVLAAQFAVLAAQLGARDLADARDPVATVHAVLARRETAWLLIFDNVTQRASVEPFLPPAGNGRVLVTTQSQHWPPGCALEVSVLETKVAAGFLVNRTGDADRAAARGLAEGLDGLPLALEQAAAYMRATGTSLADYLSLFRARQGDLLARGEAAGHPLDVAATLGLALSRLTAEAPAAAALLGLLAFLAPEPVPLALLLAGGPPGSPVADAIKPLLGDPVASGDAVGALRRYSLVSLGGNGLILVHRLVRAVTRGQLDSDAAARWARDAAWLVDAAMPADPAAPSAWPAYAMLLPHARAALDLTSGGLRKTAQFLGASGNYPAARDLSELIADAMRTSPAYGPEHPDNLAMLHEVARWAGWAGDAAGARDQYAALLPVEERVLGAEHLDTLATRSNLAFFTGRAGDAARARDQYAALVPVQERVMGPRHPGTLATRHSLARFTGEAGDAAGARDQYAALLPIREQVHGPVDPESLTTRHDLARFTGDAGDAAGARDQYAALLTIRERVLGAEHPATLATRYAMICWTGDAGDPEEARDQLSAFLPVRERISGPEHRATLAARRNLARFTGKAGNAAAARDQLTLLVPVHEQVLGPEHPDTLAARRNLARFTGEAGDATAASDQLTLLLPVFERVLGNEHYRTITLRQNLAHFTTQATDRANDGS
jgi:hypothetical protein